MEARRIHHQLVPMRIDYEAGLDPEVLKVLGKVGHKLKQGPKVGGFASVTAISRRMGHPGGEQGEHASIRRMRRNTQNTGNIGSTDLIRREQKQSEVEILVPNFDSRRWGSTAVLEFKPESTTESKVIGKL